MDLQSPMRFTSVEEMMEWPNTPGMQRYLKAATAFIGSKGHLPPDPQQSEALFYQHVAESGDLHSEVFNVINTTFRNSNTQDFYNIIIDAVRPLSTSTAFPAILCRSTDLDINQSVNPQGQAFQMNVIPDPPLAKVTFELAHLIRHPDWMGLSPILKSLKDTTATMWESQDQPGTILCLVALPPGNPQKAITTPEQHFPDGEPSNLNNILKWHGANPVWVPAA